MKQFLLKRLVIIFIFSGSTCFAQDAEAPKVDTADAVAAIVTAGNIKCDSALAHEKNNDIKGANRLYQDAIKDYKKAVKTGSSYAAYYKMGLAQAKLKDHKNAVMSFEKALAIDPERAEAYRERGLSQLALGKDTLAMNDLNKAIDKNYDDAESFYQRGLMREKGRNLQSVFEDYARALELRPTFEKVYMQRGKLYFNVKKDYVLALSDFNKAIEINPENNEAYLWRGKTNFNGGNFKAADKDLSRYIDYETGNVEAYITRGAARINTNNNADAVKDFDEVIKLDPKNVVAYTNRGIAKGAMKNFGGALEDLDMAIKLKFDYSSAYLNRAAVKLASGDKKGACKDLEKADGLNNEKAYDLLQKYCSEGRQ